MLSEFLVFLRLGVEHIVDVRGYDHIMFIVALCAGYELRHWKVVLLLISAFTVGHSITLALATFQIVSVPTDLVEVLIPITILLTSLGNVVAMSSDPLDKTSWRVSIFQYVVATGFGLVHGLGFSNFLRSLLGSGGIALPLFGFNVGVEVAQAAIVIVLLVTTAMIVHRTPLDRRVWTVILSGITGGVSVLLILERLSV